MAKTPAPPRRRAGPRRDWSKIVFAGLSIIIILSMVLSLFAAFIQ